MDLGSNLKETRTAKNISVYKLSKETDISENHIHSIEKGISQPSVAMLEKLLTHMGVTMSEFFKGGEDAVYPTDYESELLGAVRVLPDDKAQAVLLVARLMAQ